MLIKSIPNYNEEIKGFGYLSWHMFTISCACTTELHRKRAQEVLKVIAGPGILTDAFYDEPLSNPCIDKLSAYKAHMQKWLLGQSESADDANSTPALINYKYVPMDTTDKRLNDSDHEVYVTRRTPAPQLQEAPTSQSVHTQDNTPHDNAITADTVPTLELNTQSEAE